MKRGGLSHSLQDGPEDLTPVFYRAQCTRELRETNIQETRAQPEKVAADSVQGNLRDFQKLALLPYALQAGNYIICGGNSSRRRARPSRETRL